MAEAEILRHIVFCNALDLATLSVETGDYTLHQSIWRALYLPSVDSETPNRKARS